MTQAVGFVQRAGTMLVQAAQTAVQQGGIGTRRPAFAGVYAAGPVRTIQTFGVTTHDERLIRQGRRPKACPGPYAATVKAWRAQFQGNGLGK
jgi:hypothetical protein